MSVISHDQSVFLSTEVSQQLSMLNKHNIFRANKQKVLYSWQIPINTPQLNHQATQN
jgi:hypothetical protein